MSVLDAQIPHLCHSLLTSATFFPPQELIDDFIFPASNVYLQYMKSGEFPPEQAIPVCSTPATITAGFELLVALAVGCMRNLRQIVDTLTDMYYSGTDHLLCGLKLFCSCTLENHLFSFKIVQHELR